MSDLIKFEGWDLDATGDEPRVRDLDVAAHAGLKDPHDVRRIIDKNWDELESYGEIRVSGRRPENGRGRPGREYWLTEEQATALVAMLKTPMARALRVVLVKLFVAYRRGQVQAHVLAAAPIQARISDDPRAYSMLRMMFAMAAKSSGRSIQSIQGEIRKPWGVCSVYRIALSSLQHTMARLQAVIEAPPVRRLPADRRQVEMFGAN